jgi:hypothetical protein
MAASRLDGIWLPPASHSLAALPIGWARHAAAVVGGKVPGGDRVEWRGQMVPTEIRRAILTLDAGRCFFCGRPTTHVEHVEHVGQGGPENLVATCKRCQMVQPPPGLLREAAAEAWIRAELVEQIAAQIRRAIRRANERGAASTDQTQ